MTVDSVPVVAKAGRGRHANNFDLIRLLAALQVAVSHTFTWLQVPLPRGVMAALTCFPGVAIFFVISGFLVTRSYVERHAGVVPFLARRALRIYPALWLQYGLVIVLMAATGGFALRTLVQPQFWKWLGAAALVGSNFWASVLTSSTPFTWDGLYKGYPADVLWTIPVELSFYLLVPLVFAPWLVCRRLVGPVMAVAFAVSIVGAYIAGPLLRNHGELNTTGMLHSSPIPYFWLFLAGGASAFYWKRTAGWFEGRALWWFAAFGAATAINWLVVGSVGLPYRMPDLLTVPRALLLAGAVLAFAHSWTGMSGWMRGVDLSYGLYLFHLPLPLGLSYAGIGGSLWYVAASMVVAFALAALSWFLVEAPALALKPWIERWLPSGPRHAARAPAATSRSHDVVIRARDVRKVYRLYRWQGYRFLDLFGLLSRGSNAFAEHSALDGVSLEIRRGEKVAIIGRNGAGKSTLLKLITKVIEPTSGELEVQGSVHALLQIGTGFHPDFTGRDNVFAYLAQVGVTGTEANATYAEIVEFAEIEEYIDQPVKTYSTGMAVRLMFATSTAIKPDLLVLDEVLGVGDAYFAQKSHDRMRELTEGAGTTLLLVTHDIYSAVRICDRVIWIDRGRVLMDGEGPAVIKAYEDSIRQQEEIRLRLRKQHRLQGQAAAALGAAALTHAIVEVQSAGNRPLQSPAYIGRIELVSAAGRQALPLTDAAFDETSSAHLQREATAWGDAAEVDGRPARAWQNYGSPFHKIAGVLPLSGTLGAAARLEIDYRTESPFRAVVRMFVGGQPVEFGTLDGEPGGWRTWSGDGQAGVAGGAVSEINTAGIHGTAAISVTTIETLDQAGNETHFFTHGAPFTLRMTYRINQPDLIERPQVLIAFHRDGVQDVCRVITRDLLFDARQRRVGEVRLRIPSLWFGVGSYTITVMVAREGYYDQTQTRYFSLDPGVYACHTRALEIAVIDGGQVAAGTVMVGDGEWSLGA